MSLGMAYIANRGLSNFDPLGELKNKDLAITMYCNDIDMAVIKTITGWELSPEYVWKYEIPDFVDFNEDKYLKLLNTEKSLDFVCNNKALKYYPNLKNYNVTIINIKEKDCLGYFSSGENLIAISTNCPKDYIESCLVHEIQHLIQYEEGFENGDGGSKGYYLYRSRTGEQEARIVQSRHKLDDFERRRTIRRRSLERDNVPWHQLTFWDIDTKNKLKNELEDKKDDFYMEYGKIPELLLFEFLINYK